MWTQKLGQTWGVVPGGAQGFLGQTRSQTTECGRRGVEKTTMEGLRSTEEARNHHQSGGDGCGAAATKQGLPCSSLWRAVGPTTKFTKMRWRVELEDEVGGCNPRKFQTLELTTKFHKINATFGKIWKVQTWLL